VIDSIPRPHVQPELASVEAYAARLAARERRIDELLLAMDSIVQRLRYLAADHAMPAARLRRELLWACYTLEAAAVDTGDVVPGADPDDGELVDLSVRPPF
jgi:hypothetical protein